MDDNTTNKQFEEPDQPMQSIDQIMQIIAEATIPAAGTQSLNQFLTGSLDIDDDMDEDLDTDPDLDIDSSGEIVYAMWLSTEIMYLQSCVFGCKRSLVSVFSCVRRSENSVTYCRNVHFPLVSL